MMTIGESPDGSERVLLGIVKYPGVQSVLVHFGARAQLQFGLNVGFVSLHGLNTDAEFFADFLIAMSSHEKLKRLAFSWSEFRMTLFGWQQGSRNRRIDVALAGDNG